MTHTPVSNAVRSATRTYDDLCREAKARIRELAPRELFLQRGNEGASSVLVIDVREPDEFSSGHIPGAVSLPRGVIEKGIESLVERDRSFVVYCQSGKRSALAAEALQAMGFKEVRSLEGGIEAWFAAGLPRTVPGATSVLGSASSSARPVVDHADWASIRADFGITSKIVHCSDGVDRPLVYLDHAASTHPPGTVVAAYARFLEHEYANVHRATYALARNATDRFDRAFETCAAFVGGNLTDGCVVFTSNTTHGCDLVAHCVAHLPGKVLLTDLEHHSNDLPYRKRGDVLRARITAEGRLDLNHVEELLKRERVKLLAVCGAANVTGWMPPLKKLARLAHQHGALLAVDAAQVIAHVPVDVGAATADDSIDFLIAAGHKAYAPFGIGFVYGKRPLFDSAPPHVPGGGTASSVSETGAVYLPSPDRHQGGTPNVAGAIAFAEMLRYLSAIGMERVREHELELMRRAWGALRREGGLTLYGPDALEERVAILTFNIDWVNDMLAAAVLGEELGIAVRNGRFCAHVHAANLLRNQGGYTALGDAPPSAVRASFGLYNDIHDVDRLLEGISILRDRRWRGQYHMRAGAVEATRPTASWGGGRCADAWMEGGLGGSSDLGKTQTG